MVRREILRQEDVNLLMKQRFLLVFSCLEKEVKQSVVFVLSWRKSQRGKRGARS